ncbi:nuclease-related domain-containing protein [Macrococcus armenti]|uniref:nuclease-related domain-containing protein n=1 Tax=Macrococcus armenti TaxID=2875764 RepID=UPI001CD00D42|nr:nuclease-related domain-containing protein [Macrococcus armenti]UBH08255.1 NERD domain-containing protein [Macrococcus armenti]UBH10486.1 NERD domain-containing protein [Macrococcus armenti]
MILQHRKMDDELVYKLQISRRKKVNSNELKELEYKLRGYFGEVAFDKLSDNALVEGIMLRNLKYKVNGPIFQIDSLIFMNGTLYLFEVKDFSADLHYTDGKYFYEDGKPSTRINEQKIRTPNLFTTLLNNHQINHSFHYYNVFINPTHKIYGYKPTDKILEHSRISKFINENSRLPISTYDLECCEYLLRVQDNSDPFNYRSPQVFSHLKKGVLCKCMKSFYEKSSNRRYTCPSCNHTINCDELLIKAIEEIKIIFPGERITMHILNIWTGNVMSREKIRLFLNKYYMRHRMGSIIYYE